MADDYSGDDYSGDDGQGDNAGQDDDVGQAIMRAVRAQRGTRKAGKPRLKAPDAKPDRTRGYVGLEPLAIWTGADTAEKIIEVEPQRDFRPERVILTEKRTAGAAVSQVRASISVGVDPQSPSNNFAVIEGFSSVATFSGVDFKIVKTGQKFTIRLSISVAPGAGESVTVGGMAFGDMLY